VAHFIDGILDGSVQDPLVVPVMSSGALHDKPLVCEPAKAHVWWLRGIAAIAIKLAMP
jgi:hypothetical protein